MAVLCPICHKDDFIGKVSSICASGSTTASYSGSGYGGGYVDGKWTSMSTESSGVVRSTSDLAASMRPPQPPVPISFMGILGWSALCYFSIVIIVGPYFVWKSFKKWASLNPDRQNRMLPPDYTLLDILLLLFGLPTYGMALIPLRNRMHRNEDFAERMAMYDQARAVWERLYHCHRCDVVFDPVTNMTFSRDRLQDYLKTSDYQR